MAYAKTKSNFSVDYNQMFTDVLNKEGVISDCFKMFHNYSIRNQFLAYHQMKMRGMDIQPISSFTGWNKLDRYVNKGEKALYLWQPFTITQKETDSEGKEVETKKVIFKFKPSWFALSQTNGKELANAETIKTNNFDFNKVYKEFGIKIIPYDKINGNVQGFARVGSKELAINPVAQDIEMTILHEVAHIVLEHDKSDLSTDLKELEAETVAYIVGSVIGVSEKQLSNSRGYVQGWFKGNTIPEKNGNRIMNTANKILKVGLGDK